MPSELNLLWVGLPSLDDTVIFRNGEADQFQLRCVNLRVGRNTWTNGTSAADDRGNFGSAFNADFNSLNLYSVVYVGSNTLRITHPNENFFTLGNVSAGGTGAIEVASIVNTADSSPIDITNIDWIDAGSNQCDNVIARVTTSSLATTVTSPVFIPINTNNPFDVTVVRGSYNVFAGSNADGETFSQGVISAGRLIESSLSVSVVNSPNGSTVTVTVPQPSSVTLEYSLNNIDWQSSNTFPGITAGNYTAYVRDDIGCSISTDFTVTEFESEGVGVTAPVADLPSKINSIRFFRKREEGEFEIDENVMSCNTPFVKSRMDIQKFKNSQDAVTQIRSNYETITVTVTDDLGATSNVPVQKITENVGLQDSRDAVIYELPDGQAGIYFTSGNLYEYGTSNITGTYALNGALPGWGRLGNFVAINSAWYEIIDIGYSDEKSAEVLVINYVYTDPEAVIQVASVYNAQDYEVHEFLIDFSFFQDKFIQVVIDQTDSKTDYPDVQFRSEIIQTAESFNKHVELKYWNEENSGGILYSTGIQHNINLPLVYSKGFTVEESESDTTDTTAYLIESSVHEGDEFKFGWISKEMWRKLVLAINHDYWEINGVQYVKDAEIEDNGISLTNQYAPLVRGIKTGAAYTTKTSGDANATPIEIPNLITDNGNYIKYEE